MSFRLLAPWANLPMDDILLHTVQIKDLEVRFYLKVEI